MKMAKNSLKSQAFKLKGRLYTFTVLQLMQIDQKLFENQLSEVIAKAPKLFENTPVVLDLSQLGDDSIDLAKYCQAIRERGIIPVAIQGGSSLLETLAKCQGLAVLNSSSTQDKELENNSQKKKSKPSDYAKVTTTPVRSGQQVVAKQSDMIIMSSVSEGAELLADGNIHIYGTLRGRALAGISGNTNVRIFCQSLQAELVSIAGYYCLSDSIEHQDGPRQIFLKDEQIQIEPI